MSDQPVFRFSPNAYEDGAFEASDEICAACGKACVWRYAGIIYMLGDDKPIICARCIADGGVAKVAGDYGFHDMDFDGDVDPALADEVNLRTPGFSTFNAFGWPARAGVPLAFLGVGDHLRFKRDAAAIAAMNEALGQESEHGSFQYALVFQEIAGEGSYVAVLDLD